MFFNIPPTFVFSTYLTVRVESTNKKMSNVKYIKTFRATEVNVHTSDMENKFVYFPFSDSRGSPGLCRSHAKFKCILHS